MFKDEILKTTYDFALSILNLSKKLVNQREFTLANQISRSGTSIGANVREAQYGQSTADFLSKLEIALKEAFETEYWLDLTYDSECMSKDEYLNYKDQIHHILAMLVHTTKTIKAKEIKKSKT